MHSKKNTITENFKSKLARGQLFEELFSVIPDVAYFVKNLDLKWVCCDDFFVEIMGGKTKNDILGKTDSDLHLHFITDNFLKDDKYVLETGKSIIEKLELVPNGDNVPDWRVTTKIPLFDLDNKIYGIAGITKLLKEDDRFYSGHPEIASIVKYIRQNYTGDIRISELARYSNMSISSLERLFLRIFKITPIKYLRKIRLNAACHELRFTSKLLPTIAKDCGFYDQSCMNREFKAELNITPYNYRKTLKGKKEKK